MEIRVQMNRLGSKIVELHHLSKSFGDKKILNNFEYVFKGGEKIGIVGNNGTGKSTFLNMITGSVEPTKGKVVVGDTVVMGYYHQDGMKFRDDQKVIEVIRDIAEYIPLTKGKQMSAAQFLEKFLFPRDMHFQSIEKLSGGERKRLYLMTILMKNPNFLILDEPTNDLDIFILSVLEDYLAEFEGCLIIVSHDRYFLDKVVEHTFYFEGEGEVKDIIGNYTAYRNYLKAQEAQEKKDLKAGTQKTVPIVNQEPKEKKKLSYKEQQEFDGIEKEIAKLEKERDELTELLNSGEQSSEDVNKTAKRLGEIGLLIEEKEFRWLELSELA
jgi:ATP-binding cassette subfamily F protein uup